MSYQVSFGRISDQKVFESKEYQRWNDGVSIQEVTEDLIGKLSSEISAMFGYDSVTVSKKWLQIGWDNGPVIKPFLNAGMYSKSGHLIFNTFFLAFLAQQYGKDVIVGVLAHEVGHRMVYLTLQSRGHTVDAWPNELCADFIAGLILRLSQRDQNTMIRFFRYYASRGSASHPDGANRIAALEKGYTWVDRDSRGVFLSVPRFAKTIDTRGIFTADALGKILLDEIITPFQQHGRLT
ncbi:MAG TPA: hypothetical protein PK537_11915 [Candidatus Limiplasma sp.]|nr:hypothetical protein [Candidatus Limiplasma sp.]